MLKTDGTYSELIELGSIVVEKGTQSLFLNSEFVGSWEKVQTRYISI